MALVKCPECGKEISDSATTCPNCGVNVQKLWKKQKQAEKDQKAMEEWSKMTPKEKRTGIIGLIIIVILAILIVSCVSNTGDPKCGACRGSGYYQKKTCPICNGTGYSDYDPYEQYRDIMG